MNRFQIFLRKRQNVYTNMETGVTYNVLVKCNEATGFSEYVPGDVDNSWRDFTDFIEDSEKLSFSWDKVNSGNSNNSQTNLDGSNYDKGISSELIFFDSAYQFIYDWLLTTECQILNCVEVKIVDLIANGMYRIFEIKNDNIEWSPVDEPCRFTIQLREQDGTWACIHKTFIWDNYQNWFIDNSTKQHPCFLTGIEPRPRLINSVRMALLIWWYGFINMPVIGFVVSFIVNIFSGEDMYEEARKILNINRFVDAPLVRSYIENVAGKCGLTTDTIFDEGQHWQNLCLYYPQAGYMWDSESSEISSPSLAYHFDNRWLITLAELLDKLKSVFASDWYCTPNNTLVFKHTKDLINLLPIYDFTALGAEPIYNLTYTFNGDKKPAYGRYEYQTDGSDLASQEMATLYNDIIDYDGKFNNPLLDGQKSKLFDFAPTGFIRDGRAKDYLELLIEDGKKGALILTAVLGIVIIALFGGFITAGAAILLVSITGLIMVGVTTQAGNLREEFVDSSNYTGAVRLTSEQTMTPRLILWDGLRMDRAKAVSSAIPQPNLFYNPEPKTYNEKNSITTDNPSNLVYNYPLYFDGDFKGNLFDSYHDEIDNPLKSKESHQNVKWNVDLCENMLNLFGVFENQYAVIGKVVKIEQRGSYSIYARIGNIVVDYDENKINLKGIVLRRTI